MKNHLLAAVAFLAMAGAAHAQTAVGIGTGIAGANSHSSASSHSSSDSSVNYHPNSFSNTSIPGNAPSIATGLGAAGIESCNGSVGLGGSAVGGGGALGFPWQDGPCNKRLNARTLWSFGQKEAAIQQLCLDDDMAASLVTAGVHCRIGRYAPVPVAAQQPAAPVGEITDRHGRHYVEAACGSKHAVHTTTPGLCARRVASN